MQLYDLIERSDLLHTIDSRLVLPGNVFYALRGERVDGHDYLAEVKEKGAICAVVDREVAIKGLPLIRVDSVPKTLQLLAKRLVEKFPHKKIIGVTGSCGKTTTKEFIGTVLEEEFSVERSPASWNSKVTLPISILNLLPNAQILVLEMAMSQKGDIARLTEIAKPHLVVLTPITYAHSAFFSDIEGIAEAKSEIFSSSRLEHAFIHRDSFPYESVQRNVRCGFDLFGNDKHKDCPFGASHLQENTDAAVKIARYLKMSEVNISNGLKKLETAPHRFDVKNHLGVTVIDDAYNANPKSMVVALMNMPDPAFNGRKIGAFGSMGELGAYEQEGHEVVGHKAVEILDELLCIGDACQIMVDIFRKKGKKVSFFHGYEEMKKALCSTAREGDVVLVKGSNFHKLWKLIDGMV